MSRKIDMPPRANGAASTFYAGVELRSPKARATPGELLVSLFFPKDRSGDCLRQLQNLHAKALQFERIETPTIPDANKHLSLNCSK